MPVTLELTDHINEVLQNAWAGNAAILGDVPDQQHRHVAFLGQPDQRRSDLRDTACRTLLIA